MLSELAAVPSGGSQAGAMPVLTVTRDCPVACLGPLLSQPTFDALTCALDPAATVGTVAELCEHHRLMDLYGIGPGRAGEIRRCLIDMGLVDPDRTPLVWRGRRGEVMPNGHHGSCAACSGDNGGSLTGAIARG